MNTGTVTLTNLTDPFAKIMIAAGDDFRFFNLIGVPPLYVMQQPANSHIPAFSDYYNPLSKKANTTVKQIPRPTLHEDTVNMQGTIQPTAATVSEHAFKIGVPTNIEGPQLLALVQSRVARDVLQHYSAVATMNDIKMCFQPRVIVKYQFVGSVGPAHEPVHIYTCTTDIDNIQFKTTGAGNTKPAAKLASAAEMVTRIATFVGLPVQPQGPSPDHGNPSGSEGEPTQTDSEVD